jgi:putative ABC transport system permease protein
MTPNTDLQSENPTGTTTWKDSLSGLWQDMRYAARLLRKNPGFALAVIFTLALGIGSNSAIFTVTSAVLLKPLPYHDPEKLVLVDLQRKEGGSNGFSLNRYDQVRDQNHSFTGIAVAANDSANLTGHGEPLQVPIARVSPDFFSLLGVNPQLGRTFLAEEGQPQGKPVAILSDSFWHTRFGGDPSIINQTVNLDSSPYTIIGVLPADVQFPFLGPAEVWTPRYFEYSLMSTQRLRMGVGYLTAIARLRPGVSIKTAAAEMDVLNQQYAHDNPKAPDAGPTLSLVLSGLQESTVANIRTRLLVLSGAVMAVLLIACFNVASLLLSRALVRTREIAVRTALGAQRSVIIRQLLTESVLLAMIAGAFGLGLSVLLTRWLTTMGRSNLPQGIPIGMDTRVLLFTLGISILTGLVFGIIPALQLSRTDVNSTLRDEGRGMTGGHQRALLKNILVVMEVTLTTVLLIGAGLLVRSFAQLQKAELGFDPENVLSMNISLPTVKYSDPQKDIAFFDDLLRRVSALPGVRSAGISAAMPLTPKRITPVLPEGQPEVPLTERPFIIIEAVSPGFFDTLRIGIRSGRAFTAADNAQAPKVIIVNETLARRYWPNENPVGKHIAIGRQPPSEIVGVTADVKNSGLALDPQPQIYLPFPQLPWGNMNLFVRTATDPHSLVSAVHAQVSAIDADQPVTNVQTVEELIDSSRAQPRFTMFLLGTFSAAAFILAIVGIYGVLAYTVAQRRQELGIRLALGAGKADILRLVVGQGLLLTMIGVAIGLATALIFAHVMASLLYKVNARDLETFILTPILFAVVAALASYLPARRATRVHPTEALRGN